MSADRYRDLGNGTIRDTRTRLRWRRDPLEPGEAVRRQIWLLAGLRRLLDAIIARWRPSAVAGAAGAYTWDEAVQAVAAFNRTGGYAGYRSWRLPTRGELKQLLDPDDGWPRQWGAMPDAPAGRFWSSQPHAGNPRYAWCVDAATGRAEYLGRNAPLHVWLVRGREPPAPGDD